MKGGNGIKGEDSEMCRIECRCKGSETRPKWWPHQPKGGFAK